MTPPEERYQQINTPRCVSATPCSVEYTASFTITFVSYSPTPHLRSGSFCLLSFELLRSLGFGWFLCVTCPGASCLATSFLLPGATPYAVLPLLPSPAASVHPHTLSSSANYHARSARAASGHSTLSLPPHSTSSLAERSATRY